MSATLSPAKSPMPSAFESFAVDTTHRYEERCRELVLEGLLEVLPPATRRLLVKRTARSRSPMEKAARLVRRREAQKSASGFIAGLYFGFRFESPEEIEEIVRSVFKDLAAHLSQGTGAEIERTLPHGVATLWHASRPNLVVH